MKEKKVEIALTTTGQYVIYQLHTEGNVEWLEEPLFIQVSQTGPEGKPQIQMVPVVQFGSKETTRIEMPANETILAIYPASKQIIVSYEDLVTRIRAARAGIDIQSQMPPSGSKGDKVVQLNPQINSSHKPI